MKKLIILSIATSSLLFSANVDTLKIDQENVVTKSEIKTANITQGKTDILYGASVDNLTIKSKNAGNVIDSSIINASNPISILPIDPRDTIISQGSTRIISGVVKDTSIDSDSAIIGTTIDSAINGAVKIDQGLTEVDGYGQLLIGAKITSDNKIVDSDIDGDNCNTTIIEQANFKMVKQGAGSTARNINLDSTNTIDDSTIKNAVVKQAGTELTNGSLLDNFTSKQVNTIDGSGSDILNGSTVTQGSTKVSYSAIIDSKQDVNNAVTRVLSDNSDIVQGDIDVHCNSILDTVSLTSSNKVKDTELKASFVSQDTLNSHNSDITRYTKKSTNRVKKSLLDNSEIIQDSTIVWNSDITGATVSLQKNKVVKSDLTNSHIDQAAVRVVGSTVNCLTVCESNLVCNTSMNNANLSQGALNIGI